MTIRLDQLTIKFLFVEPIDAEAVVVIERHEALYRE